MCILLLIYPLFSDYFVFINMFYLPYHLMTSSLKHDTMEHSHLNLYGKSHLKHVQCVNIVTLQRKNCFTKKFLLIFLVGLEVLMQHKSSVKIFRHPQSKGVRLMEKT